jgi:hypothetical protein
MANRRGRLALVSRLYSWSVELSIWRADIHLDHNRRWAVERWSSSRHARLDKSVRRTLATQGHNIGRAAATSTT